MLESTLYQSVGKFHRVKIPEPSKLGSWGFPGGLVVENSPANAGDIREAGLIREWGRSPGGGQGNSLQYPGLENPMKRGAWWATVDRVAKSWTH